MKQLVKSYSRQALRRLGFDREHFEPKLGLDLEPYIEREDTQAVHHVGRYHWAERVLKKIGKKNILDIACGSGYGSFLLASQVPECRVTGGDCDELAISKARRLYQRDNLTFLHADMMSWKGLENGKLPGIFDAVVSFDTLEHLLHREIALINIVEHLTEDGILLLSTPIKSSPSLNPAWEHHKIEYSWKYLGNFLRRFFKSVLSPADEGFPEVDFWHDSINRGRIRYSLKGNPIFCREPIRFW